MSYLISRRKIIVAFFIFASFFVFPNNASALTCAVRAGSCNAGETALLKMSAMDNAHAEFVSQTNYSNYICCSRPLITVGTNCSGNYDIFLKLQQATNSHVEEKSQSNYSNNACIFVNIGSIACDYAADCSTLGAGWECLAKISGNTNAHIGNCGSGFTTSVCCNYTCVSSCYGGCADIGQADTGCGGFCPDNTGTACDDGKSCTDPDTCGGGICNSGPVSCNNPPNTECYQIPGFCDGSWNCAYNAKPDSTSCDIDGDDCTYDMCQAGNCVIGGNTCGGLVPCGRLADNTTTADIDESAPCNLCALFYMLKNIINFVMALAIGVGVFILVIAGLLYASSAGDSGKIQLAKSAVTSAIIGVSIIFIAWMVIAVILQGMGYANTATWNQVNCVL